MTARGRAEQMTARGRAEHRDLDPLFHQVFLEAGNMPVEYLRRVFKEKGLLPR